MSIPKFLSNRLFRECVPPKTLSCNPSNVHREFTCIKGGATLAPFFAFQHFPRYQ